MFNITLLLKTLRDLWQKRFILLAVISVLGVGVGAYVGMASVYNDLNEARLTYDRLYNLASFSLDLKRAPESIVPLLRDVPNVLSLRSRIATEVMVNLVDSTNISPKKLIPGLALSLPYPRRKIINDVFLYKGRWFSGEEALEVILDQQFAEAWHIVAGDHIDVRLPNKEYRLLIIATAFSPEFVLLLPPGGMIAPEPGNYAIMYMPHKFLQSSSNLESSFNQLLGLAKNNSPTALQNTLTLLGERLNSYGVLLQTPYEEQISTKVLLDELQQVKTTTKFFPVLFLLTAILMLNVTISRLVAQQRVVIGTLKSLGYNRFEILSHYLSYGIVVGILGGLIGIAIGMWLQNIMLAMYKSYFQIPTLRFGIYTKILGNGLIISLTSALLGSLGAAYKALRLNPAEAMRPPMPERSLRLPLEKISILWRKIAFQNKMILRMIFRNPFRSSVTIIAATLATGLVFSSLSFFDSIDEMMSFTFDQTQKQDFTLVLRDPLGKQIMRTMQILPNVAMVETQLNVPSELRSGSYLERVGIIGLPKDSKLFLPLDRSKKIIPIESAGLVITQTLAEALHIKKGSSVTLKPLLGERKGAKVDIQNIVNSYVGMAGYADQIWLSKLLGNSWLANAVLFKLINYAAREPFINEVNKFQPMVNLIDKNAAKILLRKTIDKFMIYGMLFMISFAAIIGIGAVVNTAMISLSERERDVACLRILGFSTWQVERIFFGESMVLNSIGILFGLIFGIYLAYLLGQMHSSEMMRLPVIIRGMRLFEAAVIMSGFVLISQSFVYHTIAKIDWFAILNNRE